MDRSLGKTIVGKFIVETYELETPYVCPWTNKTIRFKTWAGLNTKNLVGGSSEEYEIEQEAVVGHANIVEQVKGWI